MKNESSRSYSSSEVGQVYDEKWMPFGSPFEVIERESVFENLDVKGKLVLDLGAGTLRFSLAAVQEGARQVVAVEMLRGMLTWGIAKATCVKGAEKKINVVIADVRFLPFVDNSFDVAVAIELFEHIPGNVELFVKEVYRVLKESGEAAINTWNGIPRRLLSLLGTAGKELEYWIGDFYYRYYFPWEFKQLLRTADFSKMRILGVRNLYFLPYLNGIAFLDTSKGSLARAIDKAFRKLTLLNQVTGQLLLATVEKQPREHRKVSS